MNLDKYIKFRKLITKIKKYTYFKQLNIQRSITNKVGKEIRKIKFVGIYKNILKSTQFIENWRMYFNVKQITKSQMISKKST